MKKLYGKINDKGLFLFLLLSIAVFGFTFFNEDFALQLASLIKPDKPASIAVNSPSSGAAWQMGTTQKIIWTTTNLASGTLFDIRLVTPESSQLIIEGVTGEASPPDLIITHSVSWTVPTQLPSANSYVISITDATSPQIVGASNSFTIQNAPVAAPGRVGSFDAQGIEGATDVFVVNSFAYVARKDTRDSAPELYVIDLTTPSGPALRGSLDVGYGINQVYVMGNYAYLATNNNAGELVVVNVANKTTPIVVGSYNIPGGVNALSIVGDSRMKRVYVGLSKNSNGGEFYAFGVSNPAAPALLGSLEIGGDVNDIALQIEPPSYTEVAKSKYAHLATTRNEKELMVLNVENAGAMTESASYNTPDTADALSALYAYGKVYLTTENNGVQPDFFIFDVASTSVSTLKGSVNLGSDSTDVAIFVDRAFVSTRGNVNGLAVVNMSNPAAPFKLSHFDSGGAASGVEFDGSYAYLASSNNARELEVIDPFALTRELPSPSVMAIGSSITYGTPGDVVTYGPKTPGGGYPDKLLGLIRAEVLNRGWPSISTVNYVAQGKEDQVVWPVGRNLWWEDFPETPVYGVSVADSIAKAGSITRQKVSPVIIAMIGVNDFVVYNATAEEAFARYQTIIAQLEANIVGYTSTGQPIHPMVLVNTELCGDPGDGSCSLNKRCRSDGKGCDAPYLHGYNALIRATYPTKLIDMDRQFVARGGNSSMFPDGVHLDCRGYTIMAQVVADELASRGLAERRASAIIPPC